MTHARVEQFWQKNRDDGTVIQFLWIQVYGFLISTVFYVSFNSFNSAGATGGTLVKSNLGQKKNKKIIPLR